MNTLHTTESHGVKKKNTKSSIKVNTNCVLNSSCHKYYIDTSTKSLAVYLPKGCTGIYYVAKTTDMNSLAIIPMNVPLNNTKSIIVCTDESSITLKSNGFKWDQIYDSI
jgi:hypothetical protein